MADFAIADSNLQNEFVRVVNKEPHDLFFTWSARDYRVPASGEGFIPYQAMATTYGHPLAGMEPYNDPQHGSVPARSFERRRLEGQWGYSTMYQKQEQAKGRVISIMDAIQELADKVEFYSLDGSRLMTVVDDPEGNENLDRYNIGTPNDPATLQQMIINQKRQLEYLQQAMTQMQGGTLTTEAEIPSDDPENGLGTPQRARGMRGGIQSTPPPPPPLEDEPDNPMMGE